VIRFVIAILALLVILPGCKTSSQFAPLAFWRPQAGNSQTHLTPPVDPYVPESNDSEQVVRPLPSQPMPHSRNDQIPPAPSFNEPYPTPTAPNLFPMQ